MFKIATTETYDPSYCVSEWKNRADEFDFVLYITKNLTLEVIDLFTDPKSKWACMNKPSVIHVTCTCWGTTALEPNVVPHWRTEERIRHLIQAGYPIERIVLRVDPIIPVNQGINAFNTACLIAKTLGIKRIRSSVMQMYKHVAERLDPDSELTKELLQVYNSHFFPTGWRADFFYGCLKSTVELYNKDITFESCASPVLAKCGFETVGCMSEKDLRINGLNPDELNIPLGNQRQACMCLLKHQLIPGGYKRGRCPNKCVYCYLKDKEKDDDSLKSGELF